MSRLQRVAPPIAVSIGLAATASLLALSLGSAPEAGAADPIAEGRFADPDMVEFASTHSVPKALDGFVEKELGSINLSYPTGSRPLTVGELVPQVVGADVISRNQTEIVLASPLTNPSTAQLADDLEDDSGGGAAVVIQEGDLAVLQTLAWHCDWIGEFVLGYEEANEFRMERAELNLNEFPDIDVIRRYNPEVAEIHDAVTVPILQGNLELGHQWLEGCRR